MTQMEDMYYMFARKAHKKNKPALACYYQSEKLDVYQFSQNTTKQKVQEPKLHDSISF